MIKAILFDLDGTLLNREKSLSRFLKEQYQHFGKKFPHVSQKAFTQRFIELDVKGMVWKDVVYKTLVSEFQITTVSWQDLLSDYIEHFHAYCVAFSGVHSALKQLKKQGYPLGLITNGLYPFQFHNMQALNLEPYFSVILVSEKEGIRKPAPAIFHKATGFLNIKNEEAVYIGDNPKTDIEGARLAGLKAVWKRNPDWDSCPSSDGEFEKFHELSGLIANLQGLETHLKG